MLEIRCLMAARMVPKRREIRAQNMLSRETWSRAILQRCFGLRQPAKFSISVFAWRFGAQFGYNIVNIQQDGGADIHRNDLQQTQNTSFKIDPHL